MLLTLCSTKNVSYVVGNVYPDVKNRMRAISIHTLDHRMDAIAITVH